MACAAMYLGRSEQGRQLAAGNGDWLKSYMVNDLDHWPNAAILAAQRCQDEHDHSVWAFTGFGDGRTRWHFRFGTRATLYRKLGGLRTASMKLHYGNHGMTPLRPVITFAFITGWRIRSEVVSLEWRQVDFDAGEIRLEPETRRTATAESSR